MASAAAVVHLAGVGVEVVVGATVAIRNTSDLTRFSTYKYELVQILLFSQ